MSVAVTGSNGFLGRALVTALKAADIEVVEFPSTRAFLRPDGSPTDELARASSVCYLASRINPGIAERDSAAAAEHVATLRRVVRALDASGTRLIYPSSGGTVYDAGLEPPYAETSPLKPRGRFGSTKVAVEQLLFEALEIESVAMRISNAYGPRQPRGNGFGVIAHWLASAADGKPLLMYGDPSTIRDFVYIDDVCDAFLRVISSDAPPSVVNIGSGVPTSLAELAETITDTVGGVDIVHEPDRGFDVARTWLDVSRAKQALGWEPRVALREGISLTWEYKRQHADAD